MSPVVPCLVAVGGALGAAARFTLASHLDRADFPRGTLLANLTGSLLLGLFVGFALAGNSIAFLGAGFCGAFTTFSSFSVQSATLPRRSALAYFTITLIGCPAAAWAGVWLGTI